MDEYLQLPIPDWLNLACPRCDYPLRGLPEHCCPECGLRFNIDDLMTPQVPRRAARITPATRPVPELGLACQDCDAPLAGVEGDCCEECGQPFDLSEYVPEAGWPEIACEGEMEGRLITQRLQSSGIPFCVDQPLDPAMMTPSAVHIFVRRDYYLDALHVLHADRPADVEWTCSNCGQRVPGTFEICWKCESPRVDVEQ